MVEATFREKPRTAVWYRGGIRRISEFGLLAKARLNEITAETVHAYIVKRQTNGLNTTSINRELQILRRILRLAVEWGAVESTIKVRLLPGEKRRERVLSIDEELRYLAAAHEPLSAIASVLADSGLRPDEAYRMRWESVTWINGRHGTFLVTHGKTAAARRVLPMTPRVRAILESRWEAAGKPLDGWIWSAPTRSGHVESSSLRKQHQNALRIVQGPTICPLQLAPQFPYKTCRKWLRRLDAVADRRTRFADNEPAIYLSVAGCCARCHGAIRWAQNWAQ